MRVGAYRGSEAWLAASAVLAMCLVAATLAMQGLMVRPIFEARALVLLEPGEGPVAGLPGEGIHALPAAPREDAPILQRALDGLFGSPPDWSARGASARVTSRLLEGGRLVEIAASGPDPETAASIANRTARAFVAEAMRDAPPDLDAARARARAPSTLSATSPHALDTPTLKALRRALAEMEARRDDKGAAFASIGAEELSARRQIAEEVAAIRRQAEADLALASSGGQSRGRPSSEVRPARLLVAEATPSAALPSRAPRAGLPSILVIGTLFAGVLALLSGALLVTRRKDA